MDVDKPEILKRQMYDATGPMAVERPVIEQENDVAGEFASTSGGAIPQHLMDLIHAAPSVDPEPEEIEQVEGVSIDTEKITEENPQSRFRILDVASLSPGVCALCGSSGGDGRQFIDFGKTVDWFGVVYFCTFCVSEAAKLLGLTVTQEAFDGMVNGYRDEVESGDDRWVKAQEEIRAARILLRNCHCGDSVPSYSDVVDVLVVEENNNPASYDVADHPEPSGVEESGDIPETPSDDEPELPIVKSTRNRRASKSS